MFTSVLRYVLPGVVASALLCAAVAKVYYNGYADGERSSEAYHQKLEANRQNAIKHVAQQVEIQEDENRKLIAGIANKQLEETFDIDRLSSAVRAVGVYVSPESGVRKCPPGETGNTGGAGSGTKRERLPEEFEGFLIDRFTDADKVVAQYEACRKALGALVEVEN